MTRRWAYYVNLRPDELQRIVDESPVVYWPLGSIEHHGWHLPVGFDGLRPERQCLAMVQRTGGVLLPPMWWGGGGGHAAFQWTLYQPMEAVEPIFETTIRKLISFGFTCIVPLSGHGPWSYILDNVLPRVVQDHPDVFIYGAPEREPPPPGLAPAPGPPTAPEDIPGGDHAARWETAMGLALLPELIDMEAMDRAHDGSKAWPLQGPPPENQRMKDVNFDPSSPCFAQWGQDARKAKPEQVVALLSAMEEEIVARVNRRLGR